MSNRKMLEIILFTCLFMALCFLPGNQVFGDELPGAYELVNEGRKLSNDEVVKIEEALLKNPDDLSARTMLLGYYFLKAFESDRALENRQQHILWVIQNYPDAEIAGSPYCGGLDPVSDGEVYYRAKKLWLDQVEAHKKNTAILGNAANFFMLPDRDVAENLLIQAKALEPSNPKWSERLGHLYSLGMNRKSAGFKKEVAVKSFEQLKDALSKTTEEKNIFYMLADLSMIAFEAGDLEQSSEYAMELLNKAPQYRDNWNYGNAIHKGNLVLGRIALASGQLEEAKEYLLKSGKTPGSPQLGSFGPNMSLAKELLEKGESEVVVSYFQECSSFWESGEDRLRNWTLIVEDGRIPDFGANLNY